MHPSPGPGCARAQAPAVDDRVASLSLVPSGPWCPIPCPPCQLPPHHRLSLPHLGTACPSVRLHSCALPCTCEGVAWLTHPRWLVWPKLPVPPGPQVCSMGENREARPDVVKAQRGAAGGVGAGSLSYSVSKYERRGIQANYLQCFETNVFKYTLTT